MPFVLVKNKYGDLQRVPEHWIDHPVLGVDFTSVRSTSSVSPVEVSVEKSRGKATQTTKNGGHKDA